MINQWTSNTEILRVKPDGEFMLGNGVDPLVALGELSKAFIRQQDRIKRMEKAGNEMATYAELGGIPLKFKGLINAWREAVKYE